MIAGLLLATSINQMWYALPLIIAVSLVYAATRHEDMQPILGHALRFGGWIVAFMLVILLVLMTLSHFT